MFLLIFSSVIANLHCFMVFSLIKKKSLFFVFLIFIFIFIIVFIIIIYNFSFNFFSLTMLTFVVNKCR